MPTSSATLSFEIHPSMEIEDVFLHFFKLFAALTDPRSVAEARIGSAEIQSLSLWFSQQWGRPRMWCEDPFQTSLTNQVLASRQEMFGSLLLILASEVCRANSHESEVWPAVASVLKADTVSFPALFAGGQPTTACKKAIVAGARKLKLRNLIDRYGAQEYFDTLKLQFGFTWRGAVRRLPEWLDGLGPPIAVRILAGVEIEYEDLKSSSFGDLWKTLQSFRRGRVSVEEANSLLLMSPWILHEWVPELLRAAKLRPNRPESQACHASVLFGEAPETLDRSNDTVCEPILRWEYPAKPQMSLRLNEDRIYEILGGHDSAIFRIDDRVVDRWIAQEGGGWRGKRVLPCQPEGSKLNLRPRLLSISSDGDVIKDVDLSELGMNEPLIAFDLESGASVNLASRLSPRRDYALICDPDLSIPDVKHTLKSKDRTAYRLASPWPQSASVVCDGATYWEPRLDQREPAQPIRLTLESLTGETAEIGSACQVNVRGVPEDATAVLLIAGSASYTTVRHGEIWRTGRPVQITLGMALGEERVRVRAIGPSFARTVTPKLSLNLRGIACFETESNAGAEPQWTLLNRRRPLNRADGSGRARIFVETTGPQLFEGSRFVGKVSRSDLQLRDLHGWGAPLLVRSERQPDTVLVESVDDYGRGKFLPPLFRGQTEARISWQASTRPSKEHQILVWSDMFHEPRRLRSNEISSQKDDLLWKFPGPESPAVMAVAYKGERSSSYWAPEATVKVLKNARSSDLFALFRWLKLPILSTSFRPQMQEAVLQAPAEFVSGWLSDEALRYGLVHRPAEQGLYAVIREFLWNHTDRNETRMERLARAFPSEGGTQSEAEAFKSSLSRLGEICPSLSYNLARYKLHGDKYRKFVRAVAAAMLQQPADCPQLREKLKDACRDCASLLGIAPEELEANASAFGAHLDNQSSNYTQVEPNLRRLGETSRGRQFLTASLLLRLVERSRF